MYCVSKKHFESESVYAPESDLDGLRRSAKTILLPVDTFRDHPKSDSDEQTDSDSKVFQDPLYCDKTREKYFSAVIIKSEIFDFSCNESHYHKHAYFLALMKVQLF